MTIDHAVNEAMMSSVCSSMCVKLVMQDVQRAYGFFYVCTEAPAFVPIRLESEGLFGHDSTFTRPWMSHRSQR